MVPALTRGFFTWKELEMSFAKRGLLAGMVLALALVGCKSTHEEGVKSDFRTQWLNVAADTQTTTLAAQAVLRSEDLKEVTSASTNVDGTASGKKADGTKVSVAIKKAAAGSDVSVTVGTLGDPTLGADIAKKIKLKAEGK